MGMRRLHQFDDARHGGFGIVRLHEVEVAVAFGRAEIGHRALVDAVGAGDDPALRGLPEHLGQPHHRHRAGGDDVGQHLARPDRGQLVDVADDQQRGLVRHRLHQRLHQHDIDHRGLVDDQQVAVERVVGVALEAAALGVDLEQPVDGLGLEPGRLGHALGGAAGRGAQQQLHALCREDAQDRLDDRGLADARPAGDDQHLGHQRQPDRGDLALGKRQAGPLLDPRQRLVRVDPGPGQRAVRQPQQPLGDDPLGPVQARQKHARRLADPVGDDRALGQLQIERRADQLLRHLEQLLGERDQLVGRQAAMALVHGLGQRIGDAGAHPDHRGLLDAELHGDRVGGLEADAADVARQPVGVLGHDLDGVGAIGLEDPHRPRRADAMAVQEHHDLAHDLLLGPGVGDALGAHRADARHLAQPVGRRLDDVEHLLAEGPHQLLGVDRADAADHAGAEILLDAVDRGRGRGAQEPRLELLAMGAVVDPVARRGDPLAGGDRRGVADDRDQIAMAARLDPQNAEAVLGVVEGDPLDQAGQHFLGRWFRLRLHGDCRIIGSVAARPPSVVYALPRWSPIGKTTAETARSMHHDPKIERDCTLERLHREVTEPPQVRRKPFGSSHAAMTVVRARRSIYARYLPRQGNPRVGRPRSCGRLLLPS